MPDCVEVRQMLAPGKNAGVRAWKKELREAGVPESFVRIVSALRSKVKEESKKGAEILSLDYSVVLTRSNGSEDWKILYSLSLEKEGETASASISHQIGVANSPEHERAALVVFAENIGRCRRWLEAKR